MTTQTHVSIYEVDDAGTTRTWLGTGSLVDPLLVLVHPPLSAELTNRQGVPRLRLGIHPAGEASSIVEVIDAGEVHVAATASGGGKPLVAIELRRAASAPVDVVPGLTDANSRESVIVAAVAHLPEASEAPEAPEAIVLPDDDPPGDVPDSPFCKWLGIGCPK